ncbi:MAG: phosphate/phosphite/phosphonate ABC transporter substrate-binding protein [Candidatus Omnitrophica bacterium]|nr:phosphate/phosphite/phosphonate ABC transporter substrate-binding protein [Candidatus Omnitrophota bacterium]
MKKIIVGSAIGTAGLLVLCSLQTPPEAAAEKLVIAVQPTSTPEQLTAQATELEQFLERETGMAVEIRFPTNYAGVVEALRFGHAQAAFMSAWPAALAGQQAGAEIVLAEVREVTIGSEKTEAPYYYSYWVVPRESPVQKLSDLQGKRAAFPNPLSTSGYVAPLARMVELKLIDKGKQEADPKNFFGDVLFSGGYAQAWAALRGGQADVSIIAGDVPESLYREVLASTRVIETQGPIPSHAVVFSRNFEGAARQKLLDALLKLNEPGKRELMRKFVSGLFVRFEPTDTEKHLGSLNNYLKLTGLSFSEKK